MLLSCSKGILDDHASAPAPGPGHARRRRTTLTEEDRARLCHPLACGVILFSRNFTTPEQLAALCAEIRALRDPPLLITVDHEGGRVQRFKTGFTAVPPMALLGRLWNLDREQAVRRRGPPGC